MSRIAWSTLSGNDVESLVAIMLYNKYPRAVRIRPSQGDYGIDLIIPNDTDPDGQDVWQVKKFATNLTKSQKSQIDESFKSALVSMIRQNTRMVNWYLIMPLDPTPENHFDWFDALPQRVLDSLRADKKLQLTPEELEHAEAWISHADTNIGWCGLTACEALAANYPAVADYYVRDGKERLQEAVSDLAAILKTDGDLSTPTGGTSILEPGDILDHLDRLSKTLEGHPFFRYGFGVFPTAPSIIPKPGIIAASMRDLSDGRVALIEIYARFDEALDYHPLSLKLKFVFDDGGDVERNVRDWVKYGTPLSAPVIAESDLPGGFVPPVIEGTATTSSPSEASFTLRFRIVSPDDQVLASIQCKMTRRSGIIGAGFHTNGHDASGCMHISIKGDATDGHASLSVSSSDISGHEVADVVDAVLFTRHMMAPNRLQMAAKYGEFHKLWEIEEPHGQWPPAIATYVEALTVIQEHTSQTIRVPEVTAITGNDVYELRQVARLLSGRTLIGTWTAFQFPAGKGAAPFDPEGHYELALFEALTAHVGETEIALGTAVCTMTSARVVPLPGGEFLATPRDTDAAQRSWAPGQTPPPDDAKPVHARLVE
jgi:hypothetical protein